MNDDFKVWRKLQWVKRSAEFILCLLFFGQLYWLTLSWPLQYDLTGNRQHSLSPETLAYIEKCESPIEAYVTLSPRNEDPTRQHLFEHTKTLLKLYEVALQPFGGLRVSYLDPILSKKKLDALAQQLKVPLQEAVYLVQGEKIEALRPEDFYKSDAGTLKAFNGEQAITSALIRLLQKEQPKIYFTVGHGELRLDDVQPNEGLSQLQFFLQSHGAVATPLNIATQGIPSDAKLIVIPGPLTGFLSEELHPLQQYLEEKQGRVMVLLAPPYDHNFDELFMKWGILADRAFVIENDPLSKIAGGDILCRRFAPHPTTQAIMDYQLPVIIGSSLSVRPDPAKPPNLHRTLTPLMATSSQSFAKRNIHQNPLVFEAFEGDVPGPIAMACLSEKALNPHLGLQLRAGQLLVMGSHDWICNRRFDLLGNQTLFWNLCQYFLETPQVNALPSRPIGSYQLAISILELLQSIYWLFAPALFLGILAIWTFFYRQRQS
jgi:hypothetical protein